MRIDTKRITGTPIAAAVLLDDLLSHLRRPTGDGIFAESVAQRYARAVALLAAYDRAAENERIQYARPKRAA